MMGKRLVSAIALSAALGSASWLAACGSSSSNAPGAPVGGAGAGGGGNANPAAYSHNELFPASLGDTWTYKITTGTAPFLGTTQTLSVTGASPTSGGTAVTMHTVSQSPGLSQVTVDAQYVFLDNGSVKLAFGNISVGSRSAGSVSGGGGSILIPTADQIRNGTAVPASTDLTITLPSPAATGPVQAHIDETATGRGHESVSVTAGTFDAQKVHLDLTETVNYTTGGHSVPLTLPFSIDIWLAPGVGMVKESFAAGSFGAGVVDELQSYHVAGH